MWNSNQTPPASMAMANRLKASDAPSRSPFDGEEVIRVIASALRASFGALWCRPVRIYFRVVRSGASISSGDR
jgi:hypothetical protein